MKGLLMGMMLLTFGAVAPAAPIPCGPGLDPILKIVNEGNVQEMTQLWMKGTVNPDQVHGQDTLFTLVAKSRNREMLKALLFDSNHKANVNHMIEPGRNALNYAVEANDADLFNDLIYYGVSPFPQGETNPSQIAAAAAGKPEILAMLNFVRELNAARRNSTRPYSHTALYAYCTGYAEKLKREDAAGNKHFITLLEMIAYQSLWGGPVMGIDN